MMMQHLLPDPLLADIETVVTVAILIISFLGWLVNLANEKGKPAAPNAGGPRPRPRDERMQNEIDIFLRDVGARRKKEDDVAIEVVPDEEIRRRRPAAESRPALASLERPALGESRLGELPKPVLSDLGANVREHLAERMAERIEPLVEGDLPHRVDQAVAIDLGRALAPAAASAPDSGAKRHDVIRLLRDPGGIRQAILASEILGPPVSRRQRD